MDTRGETVPGTIFAQPWWLDAVALGQWDAVVIEKGGKLFARQPYVMRKERGLVYITMPPLTQTLGPWLRPYPGKYTNQMSEQKQLMIDLIAQLPAFDHFMQNFHYSITNWLPFYWQGFQQTTRYTYVIDDLTDVDRVFSEFAHFKRKNVKKAQKIVEVRHDLPARQFYDNHLLTLRKQGEVISYSFDVFAAIYEAVYERGCGKVFYSVDSHGNLHSAILVVWDNDSAYYLISTIDPDFRNSGSATLLVWEAIKYCAERTQRFDFEGSMIEGVENSFRAFGARQKAYFRVTKTNSPRLKMLQDIKSWRKTLIGK